MNSATLRFLAISTLLSALSACVNVTVPANPTPNGSGSTTNPSAKPSASSSPGSTTPPTTNPSASPAAQQGIPLGTALYLPFDTEAPTDDTSRRISWTTDRFGKANAAYNFSGEGSYLNVDYDLNPTVHPLITMSVWARYVPLPNIPETKTYKLISHDYVNADRGMGIANTDAGRGWTMEIGNDAVGVSPVKANEWVQVTTVYDQNNKQSFLYVNGEEIAQSNEADLGTNDYSYFLVGASPGYGEHFPGDIDDVRIYERVLSAAEVKALYIATKP